MFKKKRVSKASNANSIKYRAALENADIPPLTLDNKWHQLIATVGKTPAMDSLIATLNELIKKQGKLYNDIKDIRAVKQKLMDTILNDMSTSSDNPDRDRIMEERGRLVDDCSDKIDEYQREYRDIPDKIKEINYRLMLETMNLCHNKIRENISEINEIDVWVERTRAELKRQLIIREEDAVINHNLYTFLHDIFGSKVMEIFDLEYDSYSKTVKIKEPT